MGTLKVDVIENELGTDSPAFPQGIDASQLKGEVDSTLLVGDIDQARIKTAVNASGDAPIYACRAWVNFDGTGTVAIRASGNVSSITDNGTGSYTVNYTTTMPDANYSVNYGVSRSSSYGTFIEGDGSRPNTISSTSVLVSNVGAGGGANVADHPLVYVTVFR